MKRMASGQNKFPKHLANEVIEHWEHIVSGEYVTPPCPSISQLREILEVAYLAACAPEEGRFPSFNLVVVPTASLDDQNIGMTVYRLSEPRRLSVAELRRLAPATDLKKSAVLIGWDEDGVVVAGISDLGTSWHRARMGLSYSYSVPSALIIQIDRPGRLKVYQGPYAVAGLVDGDLVASRIELSLFMHSTIRSGFDRLVEEFSVPQYEHPKDFEGFWWIAFYNIFASITNTISASGHGGTLIVAADEHVPNSSDLRIKYPVESMELRSAFIDFINARNVTADCWTRIELGHDDVEQDFRAELALLDATNRLVEAIRLIAQFAGCDGAILITSDLRVIGFGVEIRSELAAECIVEEVTSDYGEEGEICDIEQFGMRHRSAIKLSSRVPGVCVLAVSQDGPISGVWSKEGKVLIKKGANLPNMNLPFS
ncbi:DNA integrity scanning protein DisA nucleotide-binding domain protein [Qipengyuania citrea]|uniref:DNA integrity scanning protein DisA nucleotide-binding domain protein n=2 Tax=Qipengyuania citrea TaxID=225971 RepID=A0ABY4U6V7_9SPHN|nr:diadenylate cyclase [Qipengyuania citrea]USA61501.1 DNA integrity scanning protein DisA nucleotide-binding domain protein [Qipengyuania citrea]